MRVFIPVYAIQVGGAGQDNGDAISRAWVSNPTMKLLIQSTPTAQTGTISSSGTTVTGVDTVFQSGNPSIHIGDVIIANNYAMRVDSVQSDTQLTLKSAFPEDLSGVTFEKTAPIFSITNDGKIGINTDSPTANLELFGSLKLGSFGSAPTCDSNNKAVVIYNSVNDWICYCDGVSFKRTSDDSSACFGS